MIIGLSGKAGSGKDTLAFEMLKQFGTSLRIMHFADPLKDAVRDIFGFTYEDVTDPTLKERIDPYWGFSPRQTLQLLGTEGCRNVFRQDIWVLAFMRRVLQLPSHVTGIVVADVRFPEEFDALQRCKGVLVRIERGLSTTRCTTHASETALDGLELEWDMVIYNNGTVGELKDHASTIYKRACGTDFRREVTRYVEELTHNPPRGEVERVPGPG